ncbi:unnamed protein product [Dibothriocephalus latus]|uniref:Uncharacterized protein n=1 Tax=Dibothriocephalus latus TaxID=60516 RepID=A0A3P7LL65_DIBLA|nr:unnamed protein product [Dibothriocephalus latus]
MEQVVKKTGVALTHFCWALELVEEPIAGDHISLSGMMLTSQDFVCERKITRASENTPDFEDVRDRLVQAVMLTERANALAAEQHLGLQYQVSLQVPISCLNQAKRVKGCGKRLLSRRLNQAVSRTFSAAKVRVLFSTNLFMHGEGKDKIPAQNTSMCIYSLTSSCGVSYISRTSRHLSNRIREHLPVWLAKGEVRSINRAILAHMVDFGHRVDPSEDFKGSRALQCEPVIDVQRGGARLRSFSLARMQENLHDLESSRDNDRQSHTNGSSTTNPPSPSDQMFFRLGGHQSRASQKLLVTGTGRT